MKNPASSPESNCHGKVPAQGCNLTRDMIPRQEPRRNKRSGPERLRYQLSVTTFPGDQAPPTVTVEASFAPSDAHHTIRDVRVDRKSVV